MDKKLFELIEQVKATTGNYTILVFDNSDKKRLKEIGVPISRMELVEGVRNNLFPLIKNSIYIIPTERKPIKIVYEKGEKNEL